MNTRTSTQTERVILKDGKNHIASWVLSVGDPLTVGDRIRLPKDVVDAHPGYARDARISRIEVDHASDERRIEAEVECRIPQYRRTVVTLNSSLIPEVLRASVEERLQAHLDSPVWEWEASYATDPILRLHEFTPEPVAPLDKMQAEIHEVLREHLVMALAF